MTNSSNPVARDRLAAALAGTVFTDVGWVTETASTNADLLAAARAGAPNGTVLVTDHQTAGRGRHGRTWVDRPAGALLLSILLRPDGTIEPGWLVSAVSLAVVDAVRDLGVDAALKWPNDVVVPDRSAGAGAPDRKLAGVLAESVVAGDRVEAVVIGVGCNVAVASIEGIDGATALELERGGADAVDRGALAASVLHNLHALLHHRGGRLAERATADAIVDRYRAHSATIGAAVRVELHDHTVVGRAVDVDRDGRLLVDHEGGRLVVTAGDVVHLRPLDPDGVG